MPPLHPPLLIRLRNWVGDVVLGVPTLQRLHDAGYALRLVGRRWAGELLRGHGWPFEPLERDLRGRVRQWRRLRREALAIDPGFDRRLNAVCFPFSFGSALEMRLAGLRAIGHAHEGRSPLLARAVHRPAGLRHELEVYWHLGGELLGAQVPPPPRIGLEVAAADTAAAQALLAANGVAPGYVVICPFAGGTWAKQDKTWPGFADYAASGLPRFGRPVLICPGPGEEPVARERFAGALRLEGVGLGVYAALLRGAALMISNDTGPGHIAAAVGAPLLSVLGPSDPAQWRAWGPTVRIVQGASGWPDAAAVHAAAAAMLDATPGPAAVSAAG